MPWPALSELKQTLDVESTDWDDHLTRVLAAAIAQVKLEVGDWDDTADEPDEALAQAALRLAVLVRPTSEISVAGASRPWQLMESFRNDPVYQMSLRGHRRRFSIG